MGAGFARRLIVSLGFACTLIALSNSAARADLLATLISRNQEYFQTGPNTLTSPEAFFTAVGGTSTNEYNTGTLTYPLGTNTLVPGQGGVACSACNFNVGESTPPLASPAAMDAAYPTGNYTIQLFNSPSNGDVSTPVTTNYSRDAYTNDIPELAAASFIALQGMNPSANQVVDFNSFTPNALANQDFTFFSIFGPSGFDAAASTGFLPHTATMATIPANSLQPDTTYTFDLVFDDRILSSNSGIPTQLLFDVRTDGQFTTGAGTTTPEPPSALLTALGLVLVGIISYRRGLLSA